MKWWSFMLNQRYGFWEEYFLRASLGEWSKPLPTAGAWWGSYQERYRKVRVPMLHISGWFDCCGEQPIKMFQLIRQLATEPAARENQQLMMGPWTHGLGKRKNGEVDFGPQAVLDPDSVSLRWFDHWLKGQDNGVDKQPKVRVFVMGENRWREATDWPIPGTTFTKFYLHSKGDARLVRGGGSLSPAAPADEPVDRYTYDPGNPTPGRRSIDTAEAVLGSSDMIYGSADLSTLERREDMLVYTSEAMKDPIEVTGPLAAVLYLTTSAPSTDLIVRLLDVGPDGKAYNTFLTYSGPFRTHWAKDVETGPDGKRIIKAEIQLPPTSVVFRPGHRIRVEISSAAAPRIRGLNVEPGAEATATKWNVAEQAIYHDATHASHIVLPVVPR
jgi:putative CocE/NonD family hydrolase